MAQRSPTIEGFRAAFRRPGVVVAEITWRWVFGAAALTLLGLSFVEFLDTLRVNKADLLFLRSNQPFLVSQAIGHILHGTAPRFVVSLIIMTGALAAFWIFSASVGRAATVEGLLDYFGSNRVRDDLQSVLDKKRRRSGRFRSLVGLHFLRVALAFAAILAVVAAAVIAGFASPDKNPQPGLVFLIFVPFAALVWLLWSSLNWFLSVAPIFVIGERYDTFGSIGATLDFCRERTGPVFWSSTAFGVLHLVVFVGVSSVVAVPFAFIGTLPGGVVLGAIALLTLLYFAAVDFFFTGRMAAYIAILQAPEIALSAAPRPAPTEPVVPVVRAVHERQEPGRWQASDDDILSDVPGLLRTDSPTGPAMSGEARPRWEASDDDILSDRPDEGSKESER